MSVTSCQEWLTNSAMTRGNLIDHQTVIYQAVTPDPNRREDLARVRKEAEGAVRAGREAHEKAQLAVLRDVLDKLIYHLRQHVFRKHASPDEARIFNDIAKILKGEKPSTDPCNEAADGLIQVVMGP